MALIATHVAGFAVGPMGATAELAAAIATEARAVGLRVELVRASRARAHSTTKYLTLIDRLDRHWLLRVSDHHRPKAARRAEPHYELVSLNRRSGLCQVRQWLHAIAAGQAEWSDHTATERRPRMFRRGRRPEVGHGRHAK